MIDVKQLSAIFTDCLFKEEELENGVPKNLEDLVMVEGIVGKYGLQKTRLESHRQEVKEMLQQLSPAFHKDGGEGMSFLSACVDREGVQWGEHRDMEALFVLGIGLGMAKFCLPRKFWVALPGGVPYIVVDV